MGATGERDTDYAVDDYREQIHPVADMYTAGLSEDEIDHIYDRFLAPVISDEAPQSTNRVLRPEYVQPVMEVVEERYAEQLRSPFSASDISEEISLSAAKSGALCTYLAETDVITQDWNGFYSHTLDTDAVDDVSTAADLLFLHRFEYEFLAAADDTYHSVIAKKISAQDYIPAASANGSKRLEGKKGANWSDGRATLSTAGTGREQELLERWVAAALEDRTEVADWLDRTPTAEEFREIYGDEWGDAAKALYGSCDALFNTIHADDTREQLPAIQETYLEQQPLNDAYDIAEAALQEEKTGFTFRPYHVYDFTTALARLHDAKGLEKTTVNGGILAKEVAGNRWSVFGNIYNSLQDNEFLPDTDQLDEYVRTLEDASDLFFTATIEELLAAQPEHRLHNRRRLVDNTFNKGQCNGSRYSLQLTDANGEKRSLTTSGEGREAELLQRVPRTPPQRSAAPDEVTTPMKEQYIKNIPSISD